MADEKKDAKPAEPEKAAAEEMIPKSKLDDALSRMKQYEETLALLQRQPQTQAVQQRIERIEDRAQDLGERIARRLGVSSPEDLAQVRQYIPLLSSFADEFSAPLMNIIANLADKLNELDARQSIPDYKDYRNDVDTIRREKLQNEGRYLNHTEAYDLARSKNLPKILEAERLKAAEEARTTRADADVGTDHAAESIAKAGPSPSKRSGAMTKEDFAALSLDEKEKYLEGQTF